MPAILLKCYLATTRWRSALDAFATTGRLRPCEEDAGVRNDAGGGGQSVRFRRVSSQLKTAS